MILPHDLYSSPPAPRSSQQNNPTLLVSWWCTGFALAIILIRLAGRKIRSEKLYREDKFMAFSIIPLCARMGLVHLVLHWGTNNAATGTLSQEDVRHREIGSQLVLVSRIMYAMFLWMAKLTVTEFLKRLTDQIWRRSYEIGLQCIRWFLMVTFVAVVIATLAECQPFSHYWQVVPDPGATCRQGVAQLFTMSISDAVTDLVIVGFPFSIVIASSMPLRRKISLMFLFALPLGLVGIIVYRVIGVTSRHGDQQFRSLLASIEILAAAAVSNAIVLGSFIRDRGAKKQKFRFIGHADPTGPGASQDTFKRVITMRDWGSDADLVDNLGIRSSIYSESSQPIKVRPAPIALPAAPSTLSGPDCSYSKQTPTSIFTDGTYFGSYTAQVAFDKTSVRDFPMTPHEPSFFDVGSLLIEGNAPRYPRRPPLSSTATSPLQTPRIATTLPSRTKSWQSPSTVRPSLGPKRGSEAILRDVGGLLTPSSERPAGSPGAKARPATRRMHSLPIMPRLKRDVSLSDVLYGSQTGTGPTIPAPCHARAPIYSRSHSQKLTTTAG